MNTLRIVPMSARARPAHLPFRTARAAPAFSDIQGETVETRTAPEVTLKKVVIRKAGPVRLTAAASPLYASPSCGTGPILTA
jgi:hypothetical protein